MEFEKNTARELVFVSTWTFVDRFSQCRRYNGHQSQHQPLKRVWKLSDAAQSELLSRHRSSSAAVAVAAASKTPQHSPTLSPAPTTQITDAPTTSMLRPTPPPLISFSSIIGLFSDKPSTQDLRAREDLARTVSRLRDELVQNVGDSEKIVRILEEKVCSSLCEWKSGEGVVELLNQLRSWRHFGPGGF